MIALLSAHHARSRSVEWLTAELCHRHQVSKTITQGTSLHGSKLGLDLLQLGLDTSILGPFGTGGVEYVDLADNVGDSGGLLVIPLQEVDDIAVDDSSLSADDLIAARLDAGGLETGDGVAVLSLTTKLEDAAMAVQVQAIKSTDVALDLLAPGATDGTGNRLSDSVELFEVLHVVDEGVRNGYQWSVWGNGQQEI